MAADGGNGPGLDAVFREQAADSLRVEPGQLDAGERRAMQLVAGGLVQGEQGGLQLLRVGQERGAEQYGPRAPQVDERRVHSVETRARHQADVDLRRRRALGTAHSSSARSVFFRRSSRATSGSAVRLNAAISVARIGRAGGKTMVSGLRFWPLTWNS